MSVVSIAARRPAGFAKNFPAERQYWEYSNNSGATWTYNPAASISHGSAAPAGTERYRLKLVIPFGLSGTFVFTISGDDWDGPNGAGGTLWYDGVQINANTGQGTVNNTVINVVPGEHLLEWRHGNWVSAGLTVPVISFGYQNVFYTGETL